MLSAGFGVKQLLKGEFLSKQSKSLFKDAASIIGSTGIAVGASSIFGLSTGNNPIDSISMGILGGIGLSTLSGSRGISRAAIKLSGRNSITTAMHNNMSNGLQRGILSAVGGSMGGLLGRKNNQSKSRGLNSDRGNRIHSGKY